MPCDVLCGNTGESILYHLLHVNVKEAREKSPNRNCYSPEDKVALIRTSESKKICMGFFSPLWEKGGERLGLFFSGVRKKLSEKEKASWRFS